MVGLGTRMNYLHSEELLHKGQWQSFKKYYWTKPIPGQDGLEKCWEGVVSSRRKVPEGVEDTLVQGTMVIPFLKQGDRKHLLLIANYRPPLDSFTLEFPGGNIDPNEDNQSSMVRELKEETGYTVSKVLKNSPNFISSSAPWMHKCAS